MRSNRIWKRGIDILVEKKKSIYPSRETIWPEGTLSGRAHGKDIKPMFCAQKICTYNFNIKRGRSQI
jgi:hypothetical protein